MLLLASSWHFITEQASNYLPKPLEQYRVLYVTTAGKKVGNDVGYMRVRKKRFRGLGVEYLEYDLAQKSEAEVREVLADFDAVYLEWGNTYYLLKCIRESNFESVVRDFLDQWGLYIWASAGTYVCCPNISVMGWSSQGFDTCWVTDLTAMWLIDFCIKAHMTPEKVSYLREHPIDLGHSLRCITDEQAFVVDDWWVQLVGEREEINID